VINKIKKELKKLANPKKADLLQRFFKTGKGEYGEGDVFLGIKVPIQRKLANKYKTLPVADLQILLNSKIHEQRLVALFILMHQYKKADAVGRQEIVNFYLNNTKNINNWDLIDLSAPRLLGDYLLDKPRKLLYTLSRSNSIWEKRIAVLSTFAFIKNAQFDDSLKIGETLLQDHHDLIHKGVGWMLREIGKKDQAIEEAFLKKHYKKMPRTMLRYAIEKFDEQKRKFYMKK
jgi:3-methyladenine DNA glycosylase AlkD